MIESVAFRWAGQVMETVDGLAYIGRNPLDDDNVFIATGDSGMGMTHGTIAGMLITDLIQGRENSWTALYDPKRKALRALSEFVKENVNVAVQYADWATAGEVDSIEEVAKNHGAIIRKGLSKLAIHRDSQDRVTSCSAVCPHLGCIVHWNPNEKTWDCPCHGSRFEATGAVVCGPANRNLTPT
jgi:Rieske Fe-S protein